MEVSVKRRGHEKYGILKGLVGCRVKCESVVAVRLTSLW